MAWVLITVTADGQVNTSRHPTKTEAEIAGSLARYGKTPDEIAQQIKQRDEYVAKSKADYIASHPPRAMTKAEREQKEKYGTPFCVSSCSFGGSVARTAEMTEDGLIQEVG